MTDDPWEFTHFWNGRQFLCKLQVIIERGIAPQRGWGESQNTPDGKEIGRCPECAEVLQQFGGGL